MIEVVPARPEHVAGICRVCAAGWRDTYADLLPAEYSELAIAEFFVPERVRRELTPTDGWDGWQVALEGGEVMGAGGGGMISPSEGELFVLYLDPARRGEGIGTTLLAAITQQQRAHGATGQWVSVQEGNTKGLPFYLARDFTVRERRQGHFGEAAAAFADDERLAILRLWRPLRTA